MKLLELFHLRPGELRRVAWLGLVGVAYVAAVSLGDHIAQSVFVSRVGADKLPRIFLFKAAVDVIAAALYLPLTRGRSPAHVWRTALAIYIATVLGGRLLVAGGGVPATYALYVGHECAWTILTIHWGVFILHVFDASQARRLFPLLFTASRLGGIVAGAILALFAGSVGAVHLLPVAAVLAALAALASLLRPATTGAPGAAPALGESADQVEGDDETAEAARPSRRETFESPLVRAIVWSTAAMVLVRYGLHMVSLGQASRALGDEDRVATFLGTFGAWANAASAVLGVLVVPRLLQRAGVGVANLCYAAATALAFVPLLLFPSLEAAACGLFAEKQLKDALKTPLSALFYGAEPPERRAPARALVFGAGIPAAAAVTALTFDVAGRLDPSLAAIAMLGLAVAIVFFAASWVQNRRWRRQLCRLLDLKLERAAARGESPDPDRLARARAALGPYRTPATSALLDSIARGLAAPAERLQAVAEEVLSESIPRLAGHRIARQVLAAGKMAGIR